MFFNTYIIRNYNSLKLIHSCKMTVPDEFFKIIEFAQNISFSDNQ